MRPLEQLEAQETEEEEMTATHLDGLDKCDLHKRTPYGITNVRMTQFSIARHYGAVTFNGDTFIYFPDTDELVRDDVLKWMRKSQKKPRKQK